MKGAIAFLFVINEDKNDLNKDLSASGRGPWWATGVELFSQVSTWIVVPVVLALIFGKMLDTRYGTKPIIFLSLTAFAFIFSCFKIVSIIKNYMKKLQNTPTSASEEKNKKQ